MIAAADEPDALQMVPLLASLAQLRIRPAASAQDASHSTAEAQSRHSLRASHCCHNTHLYPFSCVFSYRTDLSGEERPCAIHFKSLSFELEGTLRGNERVRFDVCAAASRIQRQFNCVDALLLPLELIFLHIVLSIMGFVLLLVLCALTGSVFGDSKPKICSELGQFYVSKGFSPNGVPTTELSGK